MGGVVPPGTVVRAVVAAEGEAAAEVGTLGVSVETGVRAACAVDADVAVSVVAVSGVTVCPVVGAGTVVESPGVGAATVLRSAAEAVGGLVVLAVDSTVGDAAMAADGVPAVAVVLVDGMTVSAVTGEGVRVLGGKVAPGTLDVISEVVEVAVGDVALVVDSSWVVAPSM